MRSTARVQLALIVTLLLGAASCGSGSSDGPSGPTSPIGATVSPTARPSSTAKLSILSPKTGSVVHGTTVDVRLSLRDARIVKTTSTHLQPNEGHVHLYVDGKLISMNYQLTNRISDVSPGHHLIQAEFVATDHAPFDPRVIATTSFEVRP